MWLFFISTFYTRKFWRYYYYYCNNPLTRGGVYWKIRPLRQSRGPRGANCRGGIFQFNPTRGSVLPFFFPKRECIGNYPSNSRGMLTVYEFNTFPLYKKKECKIIFGPRSDYCLALSLRQKVTQRSHPKNGYFTVRLIIRVGWVSHLGPEHKQMWKFWPTKKGRIQCFGTKEHLFFAHTEKNQKLTIMGGVNPYNQPDGIISIVFFMNPLVVLQTKSRFAQ